jgi:hypothetical protein
MLVRFEACRRTVMRYLEHHNLERDSAFDIEKHQVSDEEWVEIGPWIMLLEPFLRATKSLERNISTRGHEGQCQNSYERKGFELS